VIRTHRTARARTALAALLAACTFAAVGCTDDADWAAGESVDATSGAAADQTSAGGDGADTLPLRTDSVATEYVGITESVPLDPAAPEEVLAPLFEPGSVAPPVELGPGVTLDSSPHPETSAEVVLSVTMQTDAEPLERTIAMTPASSATGAVYVEAVRAALARNAEVDAEDPDDAEPVRLEYRSTSANGGKITLAVVDDPGLDPYLEVSAQTPTTSIEPGRINTAAYSGPPYESIYGLVWFEVSRDQFSFFVNRAYGISAGKSQNFSDFQLVPHNWLRLTVTPELDQDRVDVAFEVVTVDGDRVPIARAPASLIAGEQFMRTVFRQMDDMAAAEAAEPGSSTPWKVPFYYDDPEGGGVVEVIAQGEGGVSRIAYAVESPVNELTEVDFVAYQGSVEVPEDWDAPDPTCAALGTEEAAAGEFDVTFVASSTVAQMPPAEGLSGTVHGAVYRSADVEITGPIEGAESVASFTFDGVDVSGGPSQEFRIDTELPSGNYQLLGFLDVDGNADPAEPDPDTGDPVFIPIGGFEMTCAVQPVTAEFALLLPASEDDR
jgi:hypothetical protein